MLIVDCVVEWARLMPDLTTVHTQEKDRHINSMRAAEAKEQGMAELQVKDSMQAFLPLIIFLDIDRS